MFNFIVNLKSAALRKLITLTSSRSANLAAALATQQAYTLVKENYPRRWRDEAGIGDWSPQEAETWQEFKNLAGASPVRGFLTGSTFKSISYRMLGKGRGQVYLKGKWPNFTVEEQQLIVAGQVLASVPPEAELSDYMIRSAFFNVAMAGIPTDVADETTPEMAYGKAALEYIDDYLSITMKVNTLRTIRGKRVMNPPYTERTVREGRMVGRRRGIEPQFIDITSSGMRYGKTFGNTMFYYNIPSESYRTKLFGTRRNAMFRGGGTGGKYKVPPQPARPINILYLRERGRGKPLKPGAQGPQYQSDVGRIYGVVEVFYQQLLGKKK